MNPEAWSEGLRNFSEKFLKMSRFLRKISSENLLIFDPEISDLSSAKTKSRQQQIELLKQNSGN